MRRFHVWILYLFFFTLLSCGDDDPVPVVAGSLESTPVKHVYGYAYKSDLTKSSMTKDLEREQITAVALHAAYPESNGDIGDFEVFRCCFSSLQNFCCAFLLTWVSELAESCRQASGKTKTNPEKKKRTGTN